MLIYFSGTGNSLCAANTLACPGERVVSITDFKNCGYIKRDGFSRIGFVFPVYWYGLPTVCAQILKTLTLPEDTYLFACFTYNSGVGAAANELQRLLKQKGRALSAAFSVRMPDNYVPALKAPTKEKAFELLEKAGEKLRKNAVFLLKKPCFFDIKKKHPDFISGLLHNYYLHNRSVKGFYVTACIACGKCERICPTDAIALIDGKPAWSGECTRCTACINRCPAAGIQLGRFCERNGRYVCPKDNLK